MYYINYSRKPPKVFISLTNDIRADGGVRQKWQCYRSSFSSWNRNEVCVLETFLQMEQESWKRPSKGDYCQWC